MARRRSNNNNTAVKVVTWILVILLLIGAFALIFRMTRGGKDSFKTFYLTHDGTQITQTSADFSFVSGQDIYFGVRYLFDTEPETGDFSVTIGANTDVNFTYTVDGAEMSWQYETADLSEYFSLAPETGGFRFSAPASFTLQDVLEFIYADQVVEILTQPDDPLIYRLTVTSYDETVRYEIDFGFDIPAQQITLSQTAIIF